MYLQGPVFLMMGNKVAGMGKAANRQNITDFSLVAFY